jgi:hypothetical protein
MINWKKAVQFLLFLFSWFLPACAPEAPHDNPLDPHNDPQYNQIAGYVYSFYAPHLSLDNVQIRINPADQFYTTEEDGYFFFSQLQPGSYTLTASKKDYQSALILVHFREYQTTKSVELYLNALPLVEKVLFYSEHIDQWWPGEIYRLQMYVIIKDLDGVSDIDTVACTIPGINYYKQFNASERPDSFFVSIDDFELPGGSLYSVCAESCYVHITDKAGAGMAYGPFFMHRIIESAPVPVSPTGMQIVIGRPLFEWQRITLPYTVIQEIHLYQLFPGGSVLVDTIKHIAPDATGYAYDQELSPGNYIWTIGIRDEHNNFSRSKEASFIIE